MNPTHELRVRRRAHSLKQDELAHLMGISPSMVCRMEHGAEAQLADIEAMIALEVIFGKSLSQIFAGLHTTVVDAVMRRAAELEAVWSALDETKARTKLSLLADIMRRATVTPHDA